jgi:hypothetical protein
MMHVVRLGDQIGDGELNLMRFEPTRLVGGNETVTRRQIEQNVRRLTDDEVPRFQEGRGEGLQRACRTKRLHHRRDSPAARLGQSSHIEIRRGGLLEREADELAATGDARPVIELVRRHGQFDLPRRAVH